MSLRNQKISREHAHFYILLAFLCFLLFARYGLQIGVPRILLTATIALIALLGDQNEILAIVMCCIPWHEAVDFSYALVSCAGIYVLKFQRRIRINMAVVLTLIIIAWELLHCFEAGFSLMSFLFSMVPLIFLAVVLCVDVEGTDYAFIVRIMAAATAVTCIVLLTNLIVRANFNIAVAISGLQRLGMLSKDEMSDVAVGSAINPNSLGIICILAITGFFQLRSAGKNRRMDMVFTVVLLIFGALTSSRTFLICLLLMAVLMILGWPGDIRKKLRFFGILVLLAIAALLLLNLFFPQLLGYYVRRFQSENVLGGRDVLMTKYHAFITENLDVMFFGVGRNNYAKKLTEVYRVFVNVPHNAIQEIIVAWGIPGLILFTLLCGMMVVQSGKYSRYHVLLNYVPFLVLLVKSMVGQMLTSHYTMLALSYAYLSLCQDFRPKEE